MGYVEYLDRLKEMFVPKANLLITQQAFHERRQKAGEIPADYVMSKCLREDGPTLQLRLVSITRPVQQGF